MKNFINISEIPKNELRKILESAKLRKKSRKNLAKNASDPDALLEVNILAMIFREPAKSCSISGNLTTLTFRPRSRSFSSNSDRVNNL